MKNIYSLSTESQSHQSADVKCVQPRRSTLEFLKNFARACQSVKNESIPSALSTIVLN